MGSSKTAKQADAGLLAAPKTLVAGQLADRAPLIFVVSRRRAVAALYAPRRGHPSAISTQVKSGGADFR